MSKVRSLAISLVAMLMFSISAFSQSDLGTINGEVKDPSGASVPNATVVIKSQSTGNERRTTTNQSGFFVFTNTQAGQYTVTVTANGFKKFDSTGNKLDSSSTLNVDVTMTVGGANETVEVVASAAKLQTESATVQKVVTREQIDALELNGRNPIFMANLVPGARGGNTAGLSFSFSQGPSNLNGARTAETLITYDGAPAVRTRSNGTSLGSADVDSVQEIQIMTANYGAEYGRSSGGQIRITTRTGGQDFHGSAFEYVRNTVFNANTWARKQVPFTNYTPPVHYNQWGYNLNGPFYIPGKFNSDKSKIFWYWGQEWVRYRFTDTNNMAVPSALMRQGDFSELLNPANIYYGKVMQLKDPTSGVPYANNVIPKAQLSPSGIGILNAWPQPNLTTPINGNQLWYLGLTHPQNQRKDTLSVDFNITDTQRVQFRRLNFAFNEYQPLDGGTPFTPKFFNRPNQTNSISHVWTISPTLVNEVLATVSLDDVYIPVDTANFLDRTKVGINYPYIFPQGKLVPTRIPTVNVSNFSGLNGGPYPSHSAGPIYNISDGLTWVKNNHTFKFGFLFERSGENDNDEINVSACPTCTNNQNGQFSFSDTRSGQPSSGVAMANIALGLFDTYSELGQRAYTIFRGSMYEAFAQDSWKVNKKLHIDFGVRYTVIVPYSALWRNMIVFDPTFYDKGKEVAVSRTTGLVTIGAGDRYNGMVIPGQGWPDSAKGRFPEATAGTYDYLFRGGNVPSRYSDIQKGNFSPRLGIAYQINEKTVIRTGAGRFFTRLGVSDSVFLGGNPPFQPTANVSFGKVDNPGGTSTNVLPLTVTTQSKAFKNPEAWNWNFTVERELPLKSVATVAYVGRLGVHLQREANINQPTPDVVAANPGVNLDALRPYKGYNSIRETDNIARSRYDSLQISWNRRYHKGLLFGLSYTLSQAYDNGSNQRDIIPNTYNANNLWGYSEFDVRNILAINYSYDLPFFKDKQQMTGRLLGGWQLNGTTQWQTGTPCSVGSSNDYAGVGVDGSMCGIGNYWVMNGTPTITGAFAANGTNDPNQYFAKTNADGSPIFTTPTKGTFNQQNGIRDIIHNPGFNNWNMGLFKKFAIKEKMGLQFRAQAFNVFNHPNWGGASFNAGNQATLGKITGKTGDVRNMQMSLRFYF